MKAAPARMKRSHLPPPLPSSSSSSSSSSCLSFSASTVIPQNPSSSRRRPSDHRREANPMIMKKTTMTEMGPPTTSTPSLPSSHSTSCSSSSLRFSPASVLPGRNPNPNPKKRSWDNGREEANPMKKKKTTTTYMGPPATAPPVPLSPSSLRAAEMRVRFAGLIGKCSGKSKEEIEQQKKKDEMALAEAKRLEAEGKQRRLTRGGRGRG